MFRTSVRYAGSSAARRGGHFGALGLAAVLVLGACSDSGGDPGAEAAESGSSSAAPSGSSGAGGGATASASPSPAPTHAQTPTAAYKPATAEGPAENVPLPVMPELAKQESKEGLEAFAEYWYALVNYGFETGEVGPIEEVSGPNCVVCRSFYRMVNNGYKNEDWILGGKIETLTNHSNYVITTDGVYQVLVNIRQDVLEYRGPANVVYEVDDGITELTVQMIEAAYQDGIWQAVNVVTMK